MARYGFSGSTPPKCELKLRCNKRAWQAFEREGKGSFGKGSLRRERDARGARGRSEE